MILSIISGVWGENIRKKDLSGDHHISIGLKSGEQWDKQITLAPTLSIIKLINVNLWAGNYPLLLPLPATTDGIKISQ